MSHAPIRPFVAAVALAVGAFALAGCAAETSPFRGLAKKAGFATDAPPPADFVGATRNSETDYMRITRELPARPVAPRSAAEVKALEQSMESVRANNAASGAAAVDLGKAPAPGLIAPKATD